MFEVVRIIVFVLTFIGVFSLGFGSSILQIEKWKDKDIKYDKQKNESKF